jgi:flavin reductase (DIM6/NTAB) family NADH-FMN oxidoreductase RutF
MPKSPLPPDPAATAPLFREALSRFATGVTVVTAAYAPKPVGVTISSFAGVSLKPPLILFCLDEKSSALSAFRKNSSFAVHILAEHQEQLAHVFARQGARDWKKIKTRKHKSGALLLEGAMCTLICTLHKKVPAGDHTVIIGRVREIIINEKAPRPLLHTQRRYWTLGKKAK